MLDATVAFVAFVLSFLFTFEFPVFYVSFAHFIILLYLY